MSNVGNQKEANVFEQNSKENRKRRKRLIASHHFNGSIILLHDFQDNYQTVQALPTIIQSLKNQGYTFVTVSQLFEYKGINPNQEYKIWTTVQ